MTYKLLYIIFISIFIPACSDYSEELSGGYFYEDEGGSHKNILSHSPHRRDIIGRILDYDFNEEFIIAVQQPDSQAYIRILEMDFRDTHADSRIAADSILRTGPYFKSIFKNDLNYWIITHRQDSLYGPLSKQEYLQLRLHLRIPEHLKVAFKPSSD